MGSFPLREYRPGDILFREGAKGGEAYLLQEGKVEISTTINDEKRVVAVLEPITVFGEMALLLEGHRRTATAAVLAPSKIVEVPKETFAEYVEQSPLFIAKLLDLLVQRLEVTTQKAASVPRPFDSVCYMLNMFRFLDKVDMPYDQTLRNMAKALFIEPAEIANVLAALQKSNLIDIYKDQWLGKMIRIKDKNTLIERSRKVKKLLKL